MTCEPGYRPAPCFVQSARKGQHLPAPVCELGLRSGGRVRDNPTAASPHHGLDPPPHRPRALPGPSVRGMERSSRSLPPERSLTAVPPLRGAGPAAPARGGRASGAAPFPLPAPAPG
ncbi:unnamed protein product [Coccothraustes coccothraustes]